VPLPAAPRIARASDTLGRDRDLGTQGNGPDEAPNLPWLIACRASHSPNRMVEKRNRHR